MARPKYDPASALVWLKKLTQEPVIWNVPRTGIVEFDWMKALPMLDGRLVRGFPWATLERALQAIGTPAFLRTDLASAKHDGPPAYRVETPADLRRCVMRTMEDNAMKDLIPAAFLIRQWLDLEAPFAAFGGHPIAREWRFYANKGGVVCRHFYWPEEAIEFRPGQGGPAPPDDWKAQLAEIAKDPVRSELDLLTAWASAAARRCLKCAPAWSVDFAHDRRARWWLIDMAPAARSWHPEDCPNHDMLQEG